MEFEYKENEIIFNRELSGLDKLVLKFVSVLDKEKIGYVIISGYIAILFGRSRGTEDVDLFIEKMSFEKFENFWKALDKNGFECIHVSEPKEAYEEFLLNKTSIRFAEKGNFQPNFEIKFPHSKENFYSINNKLMVILNGQELITSEIEMQIAFKLKLGSEKDFEDSRHLYKVFKEHLNINKLKSHISELGVEKEAEEALWKSFLN
jgi:predicted nucleotidyltransferase